MSEIPEYMSEVYSLRAGGGEYKIFLPHVATDYIQGKIAKEGVPYEHEMLKDMASRVKSEDLVLDVGANIGNHTLFLAASGFRVCAFEPNVALASAIEKSLELNGWGDRVSVYASGLGRSAGMAHFSKTISSNLGAMSLESGEGDIQLLALDELNFPQPPALMKIDVEGMELDVLQGAVNLIKNARPLIYIECLDQQHFREIFNWLSGAGYVYWDTFNASPTHLFYPSEKVGLDEKLARIQYKEVIESYRNTIQMNRLRRQLDDERSKGLALSKELSEQKSRLQDLTGQKIESSQIIESLQRQIAFLQGEVELGLGREDQLRERERDYSLKLADLEKSVARFNQIERALKKAEAEKFAAEKRAEDSRKTISFQLGAAILDATKSISGLVRLPGAIMKIRSEARRRRVGKVTRNASPNVEVKQKPQNPKALEIYNTATHDFYRSGVLLGTQAALNNLLIKGANFEKKQRDFKGFVDGLVRLTDGWAIPPRQPNPGFLTRASHLLYCLHQSVPHTTNGYSTRSHGIATGLQQAGWKVRATTRPGFPWDSAVSGLRAGYHEAEMDGVTYAAVAGWNLNTTPLDYYLAEAADHYLREAQTSGAEIIVAASNHITALPALMAARRLGLPFVYEVRGLWEVTQASTQPEWANSERFHLMRKLEQQAAREADLVITLTEELADELASWGVDRQRIVLVPNAVDVDRFAPVEPDAAIADELGLKAGVPVVGYAGSAVAYEGLELLLESLALLKQQGENFVFVLVGDGKVIDTVKERAQALGLEDRCRFTGRVPFDQVPRYLSCMDIMPVPRLSSAVTEMVSALKPLEAMAMGKAVLLSDVSPHKTMAGDNERARLFRKDDAEDLARNLHDLMHDPKERERLGSAARAWVVQERSWAHVTSAYDQALKQVRRHVGIASDVTLARNAEKSLDQITFGLIADQFTTDTLASAVKVLPLSPDNWTQELAQRPIDVLFVESAWKGNNGQWHRRVGHYSDEEFAPLEALLAYCREQGIPTLFWNKEDPVHFDRFRKAASLCDHVFTTDSRRIIPYLATPGARTRTASSCPFYASPKIHNLLPSTRAWQHTAAYGGTYYGARYPERTEYMDKIMSAAAPLGLTIYDRQHADPDSPYKYPSGLGGYVAGDLSYEEMIQAYKAHPVQINVNSVLDSPTMFSRRVVETAACGAPLVSGPALGMNRYLDGAAHIINTESEAAQALENLLNHPAYRWRMALKGARAVMRAHTTQHRLVQMLRTAGFVIKAPQVPEFSLAAERMTDAAAKRVLAQTLRPKAVVATHWQQTARAELERAGIACQDSAGQQCAPGSLWLLAEAEVVESLEDEDFEDLAWASTYAPQTRIAYKRDATLADGDWPGVALVDTEIDKGLQLVRVTQEQALDSLASWAATQAVLALRKPPKSYEDAPNVRPKKTVLIAGHDLKFIKPFYPYFSRAGYRLLLDFWTGHNQHNEEASKRLVTQADTVFCEWMLGNAIWYANNKQPGQKLIGRLHAQELRSALFDKLPFDRFEKVIFVGPHMLRQAQARNKALAKNGVVIYNGVDVEALQSVPRKQTNGKVLGFVGIVPQSKRLDLALDILRELRKDDDGYTLRIKGKRPEDFPWMANRPEELAWYQAQYRRLEDDPLLKGAVFFDAHGNDMPEWYAGIDYVLSTSDNESFHFTVADGAAAGCIPIVLPWEGADELYPENWLCLDVKNAVHKIKSREFNRSEIKVYSEYAFEIKKISELLIDILP